MSEMRMGLGKCINEFNEYRIHQGLNYKTPNKVYFNAFSIRVLDGTTIVA